VLDKVSPLDTICDLKWNYPIFKMDRGEFRSCCRTPGNKVTEEELKEHGIDAFLNSPKMKQSRLDLASGIKNSDLTGLELEFIFVVDDCSQEFNTSILQYFNTSILQ
jgi:hypothetical protein